MALRWKVDDEPWTGQTTRLEYEHRSGHNVIALASDLVNLEVLREGFAELERDSAPHDADTIHCVDQGVGVGL